MNFDLEGCLEGGPGVNFVMSRRLMQEWSADISYTLLFRTQSCGYCEQ